MMRNRGEGATYVAVEARSERWREWHRPGRRSLARPVLRWPADPPGRGAAGAAKGRAPWPAGSGGAVAADGPTSPGVRETRQAAGAATREASGRGATGLERQGAVGAQAGRSARVPRRARRRWRRRGIGDDVPAAFFFFFFTAGRRGRRWSGRRSEARRQRGRAESEA